MKKLLAGIPALLFLILGCSGCQAIGDKNASISIVYAIAAILSLLLLVSCCLLARKNRVWLLLLFSSVLVVNCGYTFLALSTNLEMALWANRVAYLGSVFLPLSMLMSILKVTNTAYKKWLPRALFLLASVMFFIAASPGVLPVYYKDVSFAVIDGAATLVKEYGPLHPLYLFYLVGYFGGMVAVIVRAQIKKTIDTTLHAVILAIAVFINIGVWFIEQLVSIDFEMLSVSYIISEMFLLSVHLVMNEYHRMRAVMKQVETAKTYTAQENPATDTIREKPVATETVTPEQIEMFMTGLSTLTPTEKAIYDAYIARATTKEILATMHIKESTLKYHNRNLYGKLGVSTRKELVERHKHIKSVKAVLTDTP